MAPAIVAGNPDRNPQAECFVYGESEPEYLGNVHVISDPSSIGHVTDCSTDETLTWIAGSDDGTERIYYDGPHARTRVCIDRQPLACEAI